jgi:hypothetical protein
MTIHYDPTETAVLGVPFVICLDGRIPENDPILGPAYTACVYCTPVCPDCVNAAVFPARGSLRGLDQKLTATGWTGVYCACGGFLGLVKEEPR